VNPLDVLPLALVLLADFCFTFFAVIFFPFLESALKRRSLPHPRFSGENFSWRDFLQARVPLLGPLSSAKRRLVGVVLYVPASEEIAAEIWPKADCEDLFKEKVFSLCLLHFMLV
jgi:hypothetical protein